jgi:CxxC motif-containing protein (DUF1111 family)
MNRYLLSVATSSLALTAIAGCATTEADADESAETAQTQQSVTAAGAALPGTDLAKFEEAKANFAQAEDINDGLGPTFNEKACGNCHGIPALGGSGNQIERRFGRVIDGVFFGFDDTSDNQGGTLRQLFSNGAFTGPTGAACNVPLDQEAASANIHNVGRRSLPLFGLGLVDAMPDNFFDFLAAIEPASTRGTVLRAIPNFPDVRDPNQSLTAKRVQRFGIKDQQTNLVSFAGDAYINEMGISTQSCYKGTSILSFAFENEPNNIPLPAECNDGDLKPANPAGNPNVPQFTDDAVGSCFDASGAPQTIVQDDMANFLFFMEHLAPPPQDFSDPIGAAIGSVNFASAGCINCHSAVPFVTPSHPFNGVPGNTVFFPFSDFLVHDMGSLGDGIGTTNDTIQTTRLMRTAPLWGIRFNTQLLHDGRAHNVRDAVLAHDGQGLAARNAFAAMSRANQNFLIRFVNSL